MSTDEKGSVGPDAAAGDYVAIDYKALGAKIRQVRGAATQVDFAGQFGITRADVSKIERGEVRPTAELLYNICLKHHLSIEWMLSGHEPSGGPAKEGPVQEELALEGSARDISRNVPPPTACVAPILDLTDIVEWFRVHPEDLTLVNKIIEAKKLLADAIKELEQ